MARGRDNRLGVIFMVATIVFVTACGAALGNPPPTPPEPSGDMSERRPSARRASPTPLPVGRAIARLESSACLAILDDRRVGYRALAADSADGVETPVEVTGLIGGVEVTSRGGAAQSRIYDCRLVVALLAWAPALRAAGIERVEHVSTYRPGARVGRSGRPSGHSRALAIDVAGLRRRDGVVLDVEALWGGAERGAAPCDHVDDEPEELRLLRDLICDTASRDLFQIILTPHYDRPHRNHVHMELRGDVDWSFVH
jgi:hypothetical protein